MHQSFPLTRVSTYYSKPSLYSFGTNDCFRWSACSTAFPPLGTSQTWLRRSSGRTGAASMSSTWNGTGRKDAVPMYLVQKYKSILQRHFETKLYHLWKLQPWREDDGQPKRRNQVYDEKSPPPCFFTPALSYFSLVFVMEHNWQLKYPNNRSHQLSRPISYPSPQWARRPSN